MAKGPQFFRNDLGYSTSRICCRHFIHSRSRKRFAVCYVYFSRDIINNYVCLVVNSDQLRIHYQIKIYEVWQTLGILICYRE